MKKAIAEGDTFMVTQGKRVDTFRREVDDPSPRFECERIRVTHLACSFLMKGLPYTFGTEPEWFYQRGLKVELKRHS